MLRNYLKVAIRNLAKRKWYSLINILGLGTGMAICLLIVLFIQSEINFDEHHDKGDNVYRVALERRYPGRSTSYSLIPQSIGPAIQHEFPEVQQCTRIFNFTVGGNFFLRIGDQTFEESRVFAADSNFFSVFSVSFIAGNSSTALQKPNSAVVNETTARKYFGSADRAVGKSFQTDQDNNNIYEITAVCADWPDNSHFIFDMLISSSSFDFLQQTNYISFSAHTYLLLHEGTSPDALEAKFPQVIKKYVAGEIGRNFGQTFEQFQAEGNGYRYFLQPLKSIHLNSDLEAELRPNGSERAVYIFSVIALIILCLACINFVNLSTAQSLERAREVGIRKTFGSKRSSLIWQFLIESTVVSLLSMLLAFGIVLLLLPLFNSLAGKDLSLSYFVDPSRMSLMVAFSLLIGIIAGFYPAFVLSSFRPISVLKGRMTSNRYGLLLRNTLVVFQFTISVILIVCTVIVNRQMNFMISERLGFDKSNVIVIQRADVLDEQTQAFKNELASIKGVELVSGTSAFPGTQNFFGVTFIPIGKNEPMTGRGIIVDDRFADLIGLQIKEGRFFSNKFAADSLAIVLNEKAVEELGLTNPVGTRLTSPDGFFNAADGTPLEYTVVGVIKDFHFQSLHQKITPLVFNNVSKFGGGSFLMGVRVSGTSFTKTITDIEKTWKKFVQQRPFHFDFLDNTIAAQYQAEQTIRKVFTVFSILAIFIGCIGLLGLAAYTTGQRQREIGIRKVLGASVGGIVSMLSASFVRLVFIAVLVAFPVAWIVMSRWLDDFAYRVPISWWIFVISGLSAVLIALLTISFQAIQAALSNPIKSLRTE